MTIDLAFLMLYWIGKAGQDASLSDGWGFNPSGKYKDPKQLASEIKSDLWRIYHSVFGLKYKEKFFFQQLFWFGFLICGIYSAH